jgi:hypothetical protein
MHKIQIRVPPRESLARVLRVKEKLADRERRV